MRVAVTGGTVSPPIDVTLELLGRDKVLQRLGRAAFLDRFRRGRVDSAPAVWGYSSAGRALAWHARGRRFDPVWLHQIFSHAALHLASGPHRLEA